MENIFNHSKHIFGSFPVCSELQPHIDLPVSTIDYTHCNILYTLFCVFLVKGNLEIMRKYIQTAKGLITNLYRSTTVELLKVQYVSTDSQIIKGNITYRFCSWGTSYGCFSGDLPSPLWNIALRNFDSAEAPEELFILQTLRLNIVYKSIKVHLGQGQDIIISIQIYLKYKYPSENAGFCILCIDDFRILKIFNKLSKFSTRNVIGANLHP